MHFCDSKSIFLPMIYRKRDIVQPADKELKDAAAGLRE
jgi:hypothetical protein